MILLITYNKIDYTVPIERLHQAIQSSSLSWWHHLNDTWIIRTSLTSSQVYNNLAPNFTINDKLMIIEIKKNFQGWLNKDAWDWLNNEFENDKTAIQKLFSI